RGTLLPPSQNFVVSVMYGVLVTLTSWLGYAFVLSCLNRLSFITRQSSLVGPSALSAAVPIMLVYSGLLPRLLQILRRLLALHVPRLLALLVVLPGLCATSTALVFWATRSWNRFRTGWR